MYGALAVIRARLWPRSGGLRFAFRSFAGLAFLPILLILLLDEAFERIDVLSRLAIVYPSVMAAAAFAGLGCIMICLPPLLRLILGARPMDPGPLRDRLERMAAAAGYGGSRLLIVPTGRSRMANAFVAGLSSVWRYIFFTESIVSGMAPEHLECVLAHEVTHARKRHILFYLVASLAFAMVTGLAHELLDLVGVPVSVLIHLGLAWAALYWGVGFTFVSRRFEMEADLVAARLVPAAPGGVEPYAGARSMAGALHQVADLNGVPIYAPSMRHFSIERRIDILLRAEIDPSVGLRFERVCDQLRRAVPAIVAVAAICGGLIFCLQFVHVEENRALLEAHEHVEQGRRDLDAGRFAEALEHLRKGIDGGSTGASAWFLRADAERALGLVADARKSEEMARRRGSPDPRLRLRAIP
jgi:Zn-dependent protease with chaperone function